MNDILLYKQDHFGDPNPLTGIWGETDCMGIVRNRSFDGIIGIGGSTAQPSIAGKLTWAACGVHEIGRVNGNRILNFDHFFHWGSKGPLLETAFPLIACRTEGHFRSSIESLLSSIVKIEIEIIIRIVTQASRSVGTQPKPRTC